MEMPQVRRMDPEQVRVGETIKFIRDKYTGLTQQELADSLGVSRCYITLIESGRKPLNDRLLAKLAKQLGVTPLTIKRFDGGEWVDAA